MDASKSEDNAGYVKDSDNEEYQDPNYVLPEPNSPSNPIEHTYITLVPGDTVYDIANDGRGQLQSEPIYTTTMNDGYEMVNRDLEKSDHNYKVISKEGTLEESCCYYDTPGSSTAVEDGKIYSNVVQQYRKYTDQ